MEKIKVRHILVQHQYQAEDLLTNLKKGAEFSNLAQKHSLCSSAAGGGDLGSVFVSRLDDDFAEAAVQLSNLEISQPIRTKFGWHIIQRMN